MHKYKPLTQLNFYNYYDSEWCDYSQKSLNPQIKISTDRIKLTVLYGYIYIYFIAVWNVLIYLYSRMYEIGGNLF